MPDGFEVKIAGVNELNKRLEGITVDKDGNIWIVSDNTSGKAACDEPAKEKTILLQLIKK